MTVVAMHSVDYHDARLTDLALSVQVITVTRREFVETQIHHFC